MRATQIHDSDDLAVGSPVLSRQAKRSAQSDRLADTTRVAFVKDSPSPTKTGSVGVTTIVTTVSAGPSPSARRYQDILGSPSWRRDTFVRQHGQAEDPFTTASVAPKSGARKGQFQVSRLATVLYSSWNVPL